MAAVHSMALHHLELPPAAPWQGSNGICCLAPGGPSHLQGTIEMLPCDHAFPWKGSNWMETKGIYQYMPGRQEIVMYQYATLELSCSIRWTSRKIHTNVILRQNLRAYIKCNTEASIKHSHFSKKTVLLNCWGRRHSRNCYDVMSCHRVSNQVSNTLYSRQ